MLSGAELARRDVVRLTEDVAAQHIQPNGIDLSVDAVWDFAERGVLGRSNDDRYLPARTQHPFDAHGWVDLEAGTYGLRYAELVALPADCGALCFPRSSLLRMGLDVPTAVWDAGYRGRGEGLLVVNNPHGVRLQRGARVAQLVVFHLTETAATSYGGRYQHENA